ncbi:hypothetical protein G7025_22640 [Pseudomonas lurida]|uniref:hypothetical protein n=1 Tax=Pseudomonas TaxID=286 RepID=UPI0015E31EC8|nr:MULTISPECIES: hypothetical protein [Pseudomonas]MBA1296165.1 hypothetical protein [Pseudomonas lurida]
MSKQNGIKNEYYSAVFIENPWTLIKRYMPVIGADLLVACASIGLTAILAMLTYLSTCPTGFATKTSFFGATGLGAVFALAKYKVLYGRIHWVWINVAIYLICLLVALPTIAYRPNTYLYAICLLCPLTGLLILNSNRCRELRHKMVDIRHKREDIIATLKKQGRWKWW